MLRWLRRHKVRLLQLYLPEYLLRKVIGIRKKIYKAAGIGLIIGIIVAISIPKQYTVEVTLSPEMGNNKGGGLSGLAASFLGSGVSMGDGTDALNASLSADIVSSTPFLLELSNMKVPVSGSEKISLSSYLDEESSPAEREDSRDGA